MSYCGFNVKMRPFFYEMVLLTLYLSRIIFNTTCRIEDRLEESTQTVKILILSLILLAVFLIHLMASSDTAGSAVAVDTRDTATMTQGDVTSRLMAGEVKQRPRRTTWCAGSQVTAKRTNQRKERS